MAAKAPSTPPRALDLDQTLSSLPTPPPSTLRAHTRKLLQAASPPPTLVILDDDPTGTQTCHGVAVLTAWDAASLAAEFRATRPGAGFFILTNSRALHGAAAAALVAHICAALRGAAAVAGARFEVVLRGDSTLRGHFPAEPRAVESVLGAADAWVLAPFFLQGGRYTIADVHYVAEGGRLVPAGETPFARDAAFGYRSSDLREWVVEKSNGEIGPDRVKSLGLEMIRGGGSKAVCEALMGFDKGSVVIVNAACEEDVDVVVLGLLEGWFCFQRGDFIEMVWLTRESSCRTRKTFPFPHRCRIRVCSARNITNSTDFRFDTITLTRSWRLDCRWLLCSQNHRATRIPDMWPRFKTNHHRN